MLVSGSVGLTERFPKFSVVMFLKVAKGWKKCPQTNWGEYSVFLTENLNKDGQVLSYV